MTTTVTGRRTTQISPTPASSEDDMVGAIWGLGFRGLGFRGFRV